MDEDLKRKGHLPHRDNRGFTGDLNPAAVEDAPAPRSNRGLAGDPPVGSGLDAQTPTWDEVDFGNPGQLPGQPQL